jgi:hypothetical protein
MSQSIRSTLPKRFQDLFSTLAFGDRSHPVAGLYLSSYVGYEQLLALLPSGEYQMLFWNSDGKSHIARHYTGRYWVHEASVRLEIELTDQSLGSDANCETLVPMRSDGVLYLLSDLQDIATSIHWSNHMGETRNYFVEVHLSDAIPEYQEQGMRAPPWDDLPQSLRAITLREPLRGTIQRIVSEPKSDEEESEFLVEIDLGSLDGVTMNMPMCSPAEESTRFRAWAWEIEASTSRLGLSAPTDDNDRIVRVPQVGDVLISRQPDLPPLCVPSAVSAEDRSGPRIDNLAQGRFTRSLFTLLALKIVSFIGATLNTVGFLTFFLWPSLVPYRWHMILGGIALIAIGEWAGRAVSRSATKVVRTDA